MPLQLAVMQSPITFAIGNDYQQHRVTESGRTAFQDEAVRAIVDAPDFDFACGPYELPPESTYRGPFAFVWYDIAGELHFARIGQRRVIRAFTAAEAHESMLAQGYKVGKHGELYWPGP